MSSILILTNAFPYYPGEQFIEDEIVFWTESSFSEVHILPATGGKDRRWVPENITFSTPVQKKSKLNLTFRALFSPVFIREILYLIKAREFTFAKLFYALKASALTKSSELVLRQFVANNKKIDIVYCYWNDVQAYASCLLKQEGLIGKVLSRAHGFDLYEERRAHGYMPLKRQFVDCFDAVFLLSEQGRSYYQERYSAPSGKLRLSKLGVPIPKGNSRISEEGLHLVSLSSCIPVKRIDKIIASVRLLALKHRFLQIKWTHLGGGALMFDLETLARAELGELENVSFNFMGEVENKEAKAFFLNNAVDFFY
ncbi:polysaccharide biosynthesis protein [Pseudomonas aeruginosa]|uniref:polysaccharide biosynthesis protein n=1 Tax=Pseudomonas aeruginosa TaxID=287 RepID=UPI0010BC7D4A|nr:polysaccharide biosynthesis protein [Pseudomonas aeruginosa]VFT15951.1 Uncharacterised protein [Pseudomonas aeruginosa]